MMAVAPFLSSLAASMVIVVSHNETSMLLHFVCRKSFGEDICRLIIRLDVLKLDYSTTDSVSNNMRSEANVPRSSMEL